MKKSSTLLLIVLVAKIFSTSNGLLCYTCKTKDNPECFDLEDTYITAKECLGPLKWNEKFACFVNSSMVNNLIETDRSCIIVNRSSEPCLGKASPNKFGTCRYCFVDLCNHERNLSMKNCKSLESLMFSFMFMSIIIGR